MNVIRFFDDFNIPYLTTGKNIQKGWLGFNCPFCNDFSGHLGMNIADSHFYCWKCGWHPFYETLEQLTGITQNELKTILKDYQWDKNYFTEEREIKQDFKLPSYTGNLKKIHRDYLTKRNFDPDLLEKTWDLKGTLQSGLLGKTEYHYRIIIPFYWDKKIVSFDSRAVSDKIVPRYKACPNQYEIISHKSILYGRQEHWKKTGICVEGPTDVWRFGTSAFATSGVQFTNEQVIVIAKNFKRVAIIYDNDAPGQAQGKKLQARLFVMGIDAFQIKIEGDPGSMKQSEADYLVKNLIK